MNINRPLMPGFLKRAEQKMLLNNPLIWSTRVHLVLYYGILFNLLLAGLSFLAPMDILGRSNTEYWISFQIIIAIIALTIWLIYLLRFNVFKTYGNIKPLHALVTFLLYFISTGILVLSVFIYPVVECVRANMSFGDNELVQDINNMNIKLCQFEHKVLNRKWDYDTIALVRNLKIDGYNPQHEVYDIGNDTVAIPEGTSGSPTFYTLDTATFNNKLANTDSLIKLNDTLYLFYKTPELQFIGGYMLEGFGKEKLLSSFKIYNKALKQPPTPAEVRTIARELNELERKYVSHNKSDNTTYEGDVLPDDGPFEVVRKRHPVSNINRNISNIASKKYSFSQRRLSEYIRVFYYFTLGITLLIFIFRHTTVRTFFLSLLSGVVLTIFTLLTLSFSHAGLATFLGWMIGYTLLFFVGSIFTFSSTKRSVLNGMLINLFVFIVPVLPLLVFAIIYDWKEKQYYKVYNTDEGFTMGQYLLYAEVGGAVLFLVLLATYINKLYRRWYSLPEN